MLIEPRALRAKYEVLRRGLDERSLRLCAAADAKMLGYGGVSFVAKASGLSRTTIHTGQSESTGRGMLLGELRVRSEGGGRKPLTETNPKLLEDLDRLLDPNVRGDPMSPLRWTSKSTPKLATELQAQGHRVSQTTVWRVLEDLGYSMQSNRKSREGSENPDRNEQFEFINDSAKDFLRRGLPVISVDTKKKELVGNYKNSGQEWEKKGQPREVNMHDFPDKEMGKAIPYGVYDVGRNEGWVNVGITHDTAEFAAESLRRWWLRMGRAAYGQAKELLVTCDGGGSNGARVRLWKVVLRRLATELGLEIHVRHFPPGTSKWNKIEHRMFCHITENWRGRPLVDYMTVVNLISATRTRPGLRIEADLDDSQYQTGKVVTDEEMATLPIVRCDFHGEWNYSFKA